MIAAIIALVLGLLALVVLHFNFTLGIWLSAATVVAAGATVYLLYREDSGWSGRGTTKTPGIDPHGPKR
jgi:uncharacterized membrane-anchored protein